MRAIISKIAGWGEGRDEMKVEKSGRLCAELGKGEIRNGFFARVICRPVGLTSIR